MGTRFWCVCAIAGWAALCANPAQAATSTTTFTVTATVLSVCTVVAAPLSFGNYTPSSGSATVASSTVQIICSPGQDYTVALDGGDAGDVEARAMSDGATHTLSYGLYTTNGYSTIWGDGSGASGTQAGTGNGAIQNKTVYGRIPAGQYVSQGAYADLITVTVTYN